MFEYISSFRVKTALLSTLLVCPSFHLIAHLVFRCLSQWRLRSLKSPKSSRCWTRWGPGPLTVDCMCAVGGPWPQWHSLSLSSSYTTACPFTGSSAFPLLSPLSPRDLIHSWRLITNSGGWFPNVARVFISIVSSPQLAQSPVHSMYCLCWVNGWPGG